ncbi:MAG: acyl-CoA thioesterase [Halanaerobiales bacterium]|nr:acyl-CoA thioesterase [Halanaerobiales bacterium]
MKGQIQFRVRYAETDAMGIVHHANYYVWFEMGRTELFRELELEYRSMEEQGMFSPVIETQCKYKVSAKYDDLLTLETEILEVGKVKWTFGYRVFRDGELLAEGLTKHCFMNQAGRPVALKKVNPKLYQSLFEKV